MSDTFGVTPPAGDPGTAGDAGPVVDPPDAGQGGEAVEVPEGDGGTGEPVTPAYLDPEQYGDHLVKIQVQGKDVELPFKEAIRGIMQQQDYTQKTQGLAEERRKLQQADALVAALEADPAGTLRQLSDIYDLSPNDGGFTPVERSADEQRLVDMERNMRATQEQLTRQMIQSEVAAIRAEHGDFDVQATALFAQERGLRLSDAFNLMQFEQYKAAEQQKAQTEQRQAAARAAQVAHQGTATQRGTVQPGSGKPVGSLREAWELAKQQTRN